MAQQGDRVVDETPVQVPLEEGEAEEEVDEELMALFKAGALESRKQLGEALTSSDWETVRAVAHRIKGSAASFGYPQLSRRAETLQLTIDQEQMAEVPALASTLVAELDQLLC